MSPYLDFTKQLIPLPPTPLDQAYSFPIYSEKTSTDQNYNLPVISFYFCWILFRYRNKRPHSIGIRSSTLHTQIDKNEKAPSC